MQFHRAAPLFTNILALTAAAEQHLMGNNLSAAVLQLDNRVRFSSNMTRGPVVSISHGGGPSPVLGDPKHAAIVESLQTTIPKVLKLDTPDAPRAIVLVTAHWSERHPTISSAKKHSLYYDYGGFPPEAYKLKYDAPGSPDVAKEVEAALQEEGFTPDLDAERGWDHGVFIPLMLIEPQARIPIVQLSVLASESPEKHYKMGQALGRLRDSNVAIIGSGFATFHNLPLFFGGASSDPAFVKKIKEWSEVLADGTLEPDAAKRLEKLRNWRTWPHGYEMHPRGGAEHFLPLIVCAGAAGEGKGESYSDEFMGVDYWSFYWE